MPGRRGCRESFPRLASELGVKHGRVGRLVLTNLLPKRRVRLGPRAVKRAMSRYPAKGPNINRTTYQA
ncbi:MAG: hypothetical protein V7646_5025, partial [Pseudonocardia sp.]